MSKLLTCILVLFSAFHGFAQDMNTPVNPFLSLQKTETGFVFVSDEGKTSEKYTYVYNQKEGFFELVTVFPININDSLLIKEPPLGKCGGYSNSKTELRHVLEIMKNLEIVDDYYFNGGFGEEYTLRDYIRRDFVPDFGYAKRDEKFALVTKYGEFLTDFKYNEPFWDDGKILLNTYYDKGQKTTVVLDKFTGKEIVATKDSLLRYWNKENYLIKNNKNEYILTYQSKKQKVPEIWRYVEKLSIDSRLFTYRIPKTEERGFITFQGKKIAPKAEITPYTNFYKGHCIAVETVKSEQEFDYYGRALPQRIDKVLKIINEDFETVKVLDEVAYIGNGFNNYGQIIVESKGITDNSFVIDYLGNHIIPPSLFPNRIRQLAEGIYQLEDYTYSPTEESRALANIYNQKGEKLINDRTKEITNRFKYKDSPDGKSGYIYSYGTKMITLDEENNVIESYY